MFRYVATLTNEQRRELALLVNLRLRVPMDQEASDKIMKTFMCGNQLGCDNGIVALVFQAMKSYYPENLKLSFLEVDSFGVAVSVLTWRMAKDCCGWVLNVADFQVIFDPSPSPQASTRLHQPVASSMTNPWR